MNVVEFENVSKKRKNFAINNMNLTIPKGYITGFIGPNGSGKTTTIQLLMDIIQKDTGHISIFGKPHHHHQLKQEIGFVYDDLFMYDEFNIKKMKAFIAPLYRHWNEELFEAYLHTFDLPYKKKIKHFSKGMKIKCSLLFALAHEPAFIILDEPTAGLDPIFRKELLDILQTLMLKENQSLLLSTHITSDLDRIADHIIFIHQGEILLKESMENVAQQYHLIKGKKELLDADIRDLFIGIQENNAGFTALFSGNPQLFADFEVIIERVTLEDLMYFFIKGEKQLTTTTNA